MKVAINGFGRIGRLVLRLLDGDSDLELVAINDLSKPEDLAYLLKYDTNHRNYKVDSITSDEDELIIDGKHIKVFAESDPSKLPWKDLDVDIVFECTGHFTDKDKANAHIQAGAKRVIISAPATGDLKTIVYGVNEETLDSNDIIISAASCTTNALAPVVDVIDKEYGIVKGFMNTVHAYTNDQATLDIAHPKGYMSRRGRACAMNIVPASTGAAKAIGKVIPKLEGKLDGMALRVPTSTGSVIDIVLELEKNTTKEEINSLLESKKGDVIGFTMDPIVSSDVIGTNKATVVDGLSTNVLDVDGKQLVKVITWYDNEMGYTTQMVRTAKYFSKIMN
ncbi:MAG: type I glyceraldehyde-3-phosphate dehydrogenase [Bacilli bacterium]|nr:type I glyceraldehyde-3-phosphate dehydrogenase [Bacilli bacterium]